jgi:ComF family protein
MGFLTNILDLLFPPRCVFCHKFLKDGSDDMVCPDCRANLPRANGAKARGKGDFFTYCVSPLYYEGDVRDSLLRFKFKDCTSYAGVYGKMVAECIKENVDEHYDLITWAPISSKRAKKRGYDQSMLIAMAAALELNDVAVETLKKRETRAQSTLTDESARKANISGAYTATDPELIAGKTLLLIDDIKTTGATLSECARTLLMAGAEKVICATVAQKRS